MASIKHTSLLFLLPKPLNPSLFTFNLPLPSSIRAPKHPPVPKCRAFYTERIPVSTPPSKSSKPKPSEADDISILNDRIRKELGKQERTNGDREMDPKEAEKYIRLVKEQQQRGLQKLKGDAEGNGFGYKVDPYTLRHGDYVVHKKVGIGRFVAIKYDVSAKESASSEPAEYVFIEYADGMAKLPVKQAAKMLYRFNL